MLEGIVPDRARAATCVNPRYTASFSRLELADVNQQRLVASATLLIEYKILRHCGKVPSHVVLRHFAALSKY